MMLLLLLLPQWLRWRQQQQTAWMKMCKVAVMGFHMLRQRLPAMSATEAFANPMSKSFVVDVLANLDVELDVAEVRMRDPVVDL